MSILSKIFIVLLVVATIALSVAVIVGQRNVLGWQSYADYLERELTKARRANEGLNAEMNQVQNEAKITESSLRQTIGDLRSELEGVQNRLKGANAEIENLKKELQIAQTEASRNASLAKRMDDENTDLRRQLSDAHKRVNQLQIDYRAATEQLIKIQTEQDYLLRQVKILKEENEKLRQQLVVGKTASGEPPPELEGPPIRGQVTAVGGEYATINVGEAHGVKVGMRFTVFRGPNYLAQLVISRVEAGSSVGKLELVRQSVQVNDRAWNKLEMN